MWIRFAKEYRFFLEIAKRVNIYQGNELEKRKPFLILSSYILSKYLLGDPSTLHLTKIKNEVIFYDSRVDQFM